MQSNNSLGKFNASINNLIESSLILVDKHIANLLKVVASEPIFTKVLAETLKTTSYVTEFTRAKVTLTRPDGETICKLKLPNDRNRLFSLVVCLLLEVDSGRRLFIDFLRDFYYHPDSNISYGMFVKEVLKPFKRAGESILRSVDPDGMDSQGVERAENYFSAESVYIKIEDLREMLSEITDIRDIADNSNIDAQTKAECRAMCDALVNALHLKNPKVIVFLWIGCKNTVSVITDAQKHIMRIYEILSKYVNI